MSHTPLILSTWKFGQRGNAAAWPGIHRGGSSLDAVETACRTVEADPEVDSVGFGGLPDRDGTMTLDACIMRSPAECGAVCAVAGYLHPVSIARRVMERTEHVMLAGPGAESFAAAQGFETTELLSETARKAWRERRPHKSHDTICTLALDAEGELAGACSTSGFAYKLPGRVGDSPIIGHGLYVDPRFGAATATGDGELIMPVCASFLAVEQMRGGATPMEAVEVALGRIVEIGTVGDRQQVAMICLSPTGEWAAASLRPAYATALRDPEHDELVAPGRVLLE